MAKLKQLLRFNLRQKRRKLALSQAKLAEKANASTQYIAMIEQGRKFPSPEMLERLAIALEIDTLELFSPAPFSTETLKDFQNAILADLEKALTRSINKIVRETVCSVIVSHAKEKPAVSP